MESERYWDVITLHALACLRPVLPQAARISVSGGVVLRPPLPGGVVLGLSLAPGHGCLIGKTAIMERPVTPELCDVQQDDPCAPSHLRYYLGPGAGGGLAGESTLQLAGLETATPVTRVMIRERDFTAYDLSEGESVAGVHLAAVREKMQGMIWPSRRLPSGMPPGRCPI